jgi:hypothetical protein
MQITTDIFSFCKVQEVASYPLFGGRESINNVLCLPYVLLPGVAVAPRSFHGSGESCPPPLVLSTFRFVKGKVPFRE